MMSGQRKAERPRVSVIIPTYNAGQRVCRAVGSVLAQTFQDYEVIVVDDGSTDDTQSRLEPYYDSIRYFYQRNQERSAARNEGIRRSQGEYIAFLDADDYWAPHKLERQVELLDARPQLGFVFAWAAAFDNTGRVLRVLGNDFPIEGACGMDAFEALALRTSPPTLTVVARSESIRTAGLFDEKVCYIEDRDLWLRTAVSHRVGFVPEILAYYQLSGDFKPARLAAADVPRTRPYVIRKAFALAREVRDHEALLDLQDRALARAYLNAALIDYAMKNYQEARSSLMQAEKLDPGLFEDGQGELIRLLADFALNLYDTWTPPEEARAFLKAVFSNLPASLDKLMGIERAVFRTVAAGHGFRAWAQHEPAKARKLLLSALARYPELGRNVGIWSICLSFQGRRPQGQCAEVGTYLEVV